MNDESNVVETTTTGRGAGLRANFLNPAGAYELREALVEYWRVRGVAINAWVREIPTKEPGRTGTTLYEVRSDLIAGLPRGWTSNKLIGGR